MPRQLTITPAPFKSSYLAIPPTPFSPRLPISPLAFPPTKQYDQAAGRRREQLKTTVDLVPPPADPLHWLWQCHKCNRIYQLGVTRRCLDDGHFFCAGTTTVIKKSRGKGGKVVRRHAACASEFDYQGWKGWGVWRRSVGEQVNAAEALLKAEEAFESAFRERDGPSWSANHSRNGSAQRYWEKSQATMQKDCWEKCDYPSECRWGKQYGVKTPTPTATIPPSPPTVASSSSAIAGEDKEDQDSERDDPATSFEEILLSLSRSATGGSSPSPSPSSSSPSSPSSAVTGGGGNNGGDIADLPIVLEEPLLDYLEPLSPRRSQRQKSVTEGETPIVSMDDLLESVKRRKRRSSGQIPSPLGANPPSPVFMEPEMDLGDGGDGAKLERSSSANNAAVAARGQKHSIVLGGALQRAFDDLDVGVTSGGWSFQEKAGGFVRGLVVGSTKKKNSHNSKGSRGKRDS